MMTAGSRGKFHSFGSAIIWFRQPLALVLLIITLFMGYRATHLPIATRFEDLFPANHPNTQLYRQFRNSYGGAQTLVLMIRVKSGDIFNFKTLHDIQDMTSEVDALPGINHNEVFSLASYRVLYARALPGELVAAPYMYPKVPDTQAGVHDLKDIVNTHREQLAAYVTLDGKGALVIASFNDQSLNYKALFDGVEKIIAKHQDANTRIYASGDAMFAAWGYHYLPRIKTIFLLSIALMLVVLYLSLGRNGAWWVPILTGICSAIWGLGFASLMGFNFDPIMLVIPFIMTARDLSHGIQWQGRYYDELRRLDNPTLACESTANLMLMPGALAIFANVAGIIFISTGSIPVLRQIGIGGAVWMGASLAMVLVFQPIVMSYLPRPRLRVRAPSGPDRGTGHSPFAGRLAAFAIKPGFARLALMACAVGLIVVGLAAQRSVRIGYQTAGTPIYRSDAKINLDTAEIGRFVPTNIGWIVLETPDYPSSQSTIGVNTIRMADDLSYYLQTRGDVVAVLDFSTIASKPMNMLLHNGFPKYYAIPDGDQLSANLMGFFFAAAAPDEAQSYFANAPSTTSACIRILLPDHTYARLKRIRADIDTFIHERVATDPGLNQVRLRYLGGEAGLYLASDDVAAQLNRRNLSLVLIAILLGCCVAFRSVTAGVLFAAAGVAANFIAFAYMNGRNIGLTVDTLPVISLGIGLGIDYGIYTVARIRDEVISGMKLDDAISSAITSTGVWVFWTFAVMVSGIFAWVFSPLLFHNEMSILLILLMAVNLIVGVLMLPAYIAWRRPRFITRYERGDRASHAPQAAGA
ncbi:MAG: MMPL family transporter [Candidatus Binataceae bacterium]|nr:MMPL family transporter [Candidatus Binataceae bacterium]